MNKVIFLDIDGPVIPTSVDMYDTIFRTTYDPESIEYLNLLCAITGARVVTNSTHNYEDWFENELKDDLIEWGLRRDFIHPRWRTIFPMIDYTKINSKVRGIGRLVAINHWIKSHGNANWVCFDDRKFTDAKNLIHIEDGNGIKARHFNIAIDLLGKR